MDQQPKTTKKAKRTTSPVRDLKPKKDAKGGDLYQSCSTGKHFPPVTINP
jgi:hypothetical protein